MMTIGMIGGIGPESTIEYYRLIIAGYRARVRGGIEAIVLGGTELSLILRDASYSGIPVLDTTRIHAERPDHTFPAH